MAQEVYESQEYSIKLLQIPRVSNTNRSDLSIEFVNWNTLNESDREAYKKISTIIKDKKIIQNVANNNMLRPSQVAKAVKDKTGLDFRTHHHTYIWKAFSIRPIGESKDKFETNDKYCIYDEPHDDYLYTEAWVDFIVKLFQEYDFSLENIISKCSTPLNLKDYE